MNKEQINKLAQNIEAISEHFEVKPWMPNIKFLKDDVDFKSIDTPKHYSEIIYELNDVLRQTRFLFLYSIFDIMCKEEGKLYYFTTPYQANMSYHAVVKKEGDFYLQDEDGDFREIFSSEEFVQFIDDLYWRLYDDE